MVVNTRFHVFYGKVYHSQSSVPSSPGRRYSPPERDSRPLFLVRRHSADSGSNYNNNTNTRATFEWLTSAEPEPPLFAADVAAYPE